jgi:hypothetical protein
MKFLFVIAALFVGNLYALNLNENSYNSSVAKACKK